ncbi:hypothetical protein B296_00048557 [Ensete ventricosum]|uniref:Uncharacterized protein n=1 Tax=Ensete ventricosum TaxID=4639 RepID=A0A426XZP1_ENSVE|nr:hypothetical protein B296_00048557 [Ensete ventricosum]
MQFVTRRRRIVGERSLLLAQGEGSRRRCRYTDRPLPDGSTKNRPLAVDFDRRRSIEQEKGKKKKKRQEEKKKRGGEERPSARAPSSLACRRRPRVVGAFSPTRGERSRQHHSFSLFFF